MHKDPPRRWSVGSASQTSLSDIRAQRKTPCARCSQSHNDHLLGLVIARQRKAEKWRQGKRKWCWSGENETEAEDNGRARKAEGEDASLLPQEQE